MNKNKLQQAANVILVAITKCEVESIRRGVHHGECPSHSTAQSVGHG